MVYCIHYDFVAIIIVVIIVEMSILKLDDVLKYLSLESRNLCNN